MQVANLVLPWFASTTALAHIAASLESAADICQQCVSYMHQQCAYEAGQGPKPDSPPAQGLQKRVAGPLGKPLMTPLKLCQRPETGIFF